MEPSAMSKLALGAANQCSGLVDSISKLLDETRDAPVDFLATLLESARILNVALRRVGRNLEQQIHPLPFEAEHQKNILQILRSCKRTLDQLHEELPELDEHPGTIVGAQAALDLSLKESEIRALLHRINSYAQILQLSLITLSLQSLWETYRNREQIQSEIRKLTDAIRTSNLIFDGARRGSKDDRTQTDDAARLRQELQAWRVSANDVVAAVSLHGCDNSITWATSSDSASTVRSSSFDSRMAREADEPEEGKPDSDSDDEDDGEDDFDPQPHLNDCPSQEIMQSQLQANQSIVQRLAACGIYERAAGFQKKGLELRHQLLVAHGVPFQVPDQVAMHERLADMLLSAQTKEGNREAKRILQKLLKEECTLPPEEQDGETVARHYHKLGELMLRLGKFDQAIRFLGRALEGREAIASRPSEEMVDTTTVLVKALQLHKEFDKAQGYIEWLKRDVEPFVPPCLPEVAPNPSLLGENWPSVMPRSYDWCKRNGFNVDGPGFGFDSPDFQMRTTPLHKAVQEENAELVKEMLDYVVSFDRGEEVGLPPPIALAASTRDRETVTALLNKGVRVNTRDRAGMTPLHRCQSKSGGVQVAELLLNCAPEIIDTLDNSGKTALFMASEMGNEKMVLWLLGRGADPNIAHQPTRGISLCTPLIAAIQFVATKSARKIGMIEALMKNGANPRMTDSDGRDAFFVASNAGLASGEIKRLLNEYAYSGRRASNTSNNTAHPRPSMSRPSISSQPPVSPEPAKQSAFRRLARISGSSS